MSHKRSHVHRRQPRQGGILDPGESYTDLADSLTSPSTLQKRVVTIYKTETPEGWAGGALTTLERQTSTKVVEATITSIQSEDNDIIPTTTQSIAEETTAKETTAKETTAKETTAKETTAKETAGATSANVIATSSKDDDNSLPTAIIATTATGSETAGVLAMATETPASIGSVLSTLTADSKVASSTGVSAATAMVSSSAISAASAASATQSASSSNSSGSTTGTKAGIAIGVLAGIFVVLAMVYLVIRKRKKQLQEEGPADNEKLGGSLEGEATVPPATPAKAPRLSLRPMTQLFMGAPDPADRQVNKGPQQTVDMVDSPTMKPPPGADAWERPMTSDSQNVRNPFGNHAETIMEEPATPRNPASPMTPKSEMSTQMPSPTWAVGLSPAPRASAITTDSAVPAPTVTSSPPQSPSQSVPRGPSVDANLSPLQADTLQANLVGQAITTPTASEAAVDVAGATAGTAVGTMTTPSLQRKQSVRRDNAPAPLDLTLPPKMTIVPPSPTGTEFSLQEAESGQSPNQSSASAAAIAAAGGPANSNVHRVQLDFKPTMDDELALHAGQVVRLLHEYDDGWVSEPQEATWKHGTNENRLFVFVLTGPSKALFRELACRHGL